MGKNNLVHVENGEAIDSEYILKIRPWIEDYIRANKTDFSYTKLFWDYKPKTKTFSFKLKFYA